MAWAPDKAEFRLIPNIDNHYNNMLKIINEFEIDKLNKIIKENEKLCQTIKQRCVDRWMDTIFQILRDMIRGPVQTRKWFPLIWDFCYLHYSSFEENDPLKGTDSRFKSFIFYKLCCREINYKCRCIIPKVITSRNSITVSYGVSEKDPYKNLGLSSEKLIQTGTFDLHLLVQSTESLENLDQSMEKFGIVDLKSWQDSNREKIRSQLIESVPKWISNNSNSTNSYFYTNLEELISNSKDPEIQKYARSWSDMVSYHLNYKDDRSIPEQFLKNDFLIPDPKTLIGPRTYEFHFNNQIYTINPFQTIFSIYDQFIKRKKELFFLFLIREYNPECVLYNEYLPLDLFMELINNDLYRIY